MKLTWAIWAFCLLFIHSVSHSFLFDFVCLPHFLFKTGDNKGLPLGINYLYSFCMWQSLWRESFGKNNCDNKNYRTAESKFFIILVTIQSTALIPCSNTSIKYTINCFHIIFLHNVLILWCLVRKAFTIITPLYKSGDSTETNNYRPVWVLLTLGYFQTTYLCLWVSYCLLSPVLGSSRRSHKQSIPCRLHGRLT